jgi:hypothetical protein
MKTNRFTYALIAAVLVAAAAVVAFVRPTVGVDGVIGYGAALALVGLAAIDYRAKARVAGR